jgi:Phage integrase family
MTKELLDAEFTQRTRTFLFSAIGCVVAEMMGCARIRFFENGIMSFNLPIAPQIVGSRATRSTHPRALRQMTDFANHILGHPFEVANPFLWRTKAELVRLARSVIETRRGQHSTHVFAYNGKPVLRMLNSAWKKARARTALPRLRVHDPKHTFGRRLRAAGVSFEDRQDLLGHRSARITTHYSPAELSGLIEAAERVSEQNGARPELVVLRGKLRTTPAKLPQAMRLASVQAFEIIGAG